MSPDASRGHDLTDQLFAGVDADAQRTIIAQATRRKLRSGQVLCRIDLGLRSGTRLPHGIDIRIKNEQLAALADISAFTTSRLLRQWERKGAVKKRRGAVRIVDPDRLLPH